jgi:hypothetical protein
MSASVVFLIGLYFVDYAAPTPSPYHAGPGRTIFSAIDVLALGAGILGPSAMPIARWLLVGLGLGTLATLVARARASAEERWRELGILACAVGSIALALGIGWGRGAFPAGGVSLRYVTFSAPFLALLYLAWCPGWTGIAGRIVQYGLCFGMTALSPGLFVQGRDFGEMRRRATEDLVRDADAGLLPEELAERHAESFYMREGNFADVLEHMRILGMPPYRTRGTGPELDLRSARPFFRWSVQPIETHSDRPITRRKMLNVWAVLVHAPTELVFEIPPGARAAHGGFGVNPLAYSKPERSLGESRFSIEYVASGDDREILFERILDPVNRPEDRTIQHFALELPSNASGRLVLSLAGAGVGDESIDLGFWTGLEFD